uniref:RNase H type-1 domain-containing protein n=1 Tax=Ananas comosus var. bracteatus TaxID=296719 RepID=A0A6V7NXF5_ANACO|nr:unnamed protein product [Ananas comosus var. bracteatus]
MMPNSLISGRVLCLSRITTALFSRYRHCNAGSCTWRKPEIGYIKLNFDGASKYGTNNASIGGVFRNHEGIFLLGYAERIGKATSSVAELVAAKRGIELALMNSWLDLQIEGDAKAVVDLITNEMKLRSKEDLRHVRDISAMISQLNDFNASHIYREGNKVADKLAKLGYKMPKPRIWRDVPPNEVLCFLRHDADGNVAHRKS